MKKLMTFALTLVLLLTFAACGSTDSSTPQVSQPDASVGAESSVADEQDFAGKTLTVGIWGGNDQETRSIEQVKADFEALTGATVELKVYTDYNVQLEADFVAKTAPDVFYIDASMFDYIASLDVLIPMDAAEMGAENYYANMIDAFTTDDGTLYALPKDLSTLALYYNIDLLESVGMSAADIPTALEDYASFLTDLQGKLDAEYGEGQISAMTYNLDLARNLHLLTRDGGQLIDENGYATLENEKVVENFDFIKTLIDTKAYKTPADLGTGWNGEAFGTGKTVIMEEGNWVYGTLNNDYSDINFGVMDMPSYKGEKSSMLFTVGYGIYANSEEVELAKEWIKYATGIDGMYTWCSGVGTLPSRQDVADKLNLADEPALSVHLAQVDYAMAWQLGQYASIVNGAYQNFLPEAVNGKTDVSEAMAQADKQANQQIENG